MGEIYLYYDGEEFPKGMYRIYSIENDDRGYPKFLFRVNKSWRWKSAKYFIPRDESPLFDVFDVCDRLE